MKLKEREFLKLKTIRELEAEGFIVSYTHDKEAIDKEGAGGLFNYEETKCQLVKNKINIARSRSYPLGQVIKISLCNWEYKKIVCFPTSFKYLVYMYQKKQNWISLREFNRRTDDIKKVTKILLDGGIDIEKEYL